MNVNVVRGYSIVLEQGPTSWGAYVPDLPGCVAVADTRAEVLRSIDKAIQMHLDGLVKDGLPIPPAREAV